MIKKSVENQTSVSVKTYFSNINFLKVASNECPRVYEGRAGFIGIRLDQLHRALYSEGPSTWFKAFLSLS